MPKNSFEFKKKIVDYLYNQIEDIKKSTMIGFSVKYKVTTQNITEKDNHYG